MDLQTDPAYQALNVQMLSIAFDPVNEQIVAIPEYGIPDDVPLLIDSDHSVSERYDVLQWAVATGEPGHTFILVDEQGEIAWIRDYGAPPDGVMYVPPTDLVSQMRAALN